MNQKAQKENKYAAGKVFVTVGSVILLFFATVVLLMVANFLANLYMEEGFAGVAKIRLRNVFYWRALLILALSSVVYTPFSYGISYLFYRNATGMGVQVRHLFFFFGAPRFLGKAICAKIVISLMTAMLGILVLLLVCAIQLGLLFPVLLWQQADFFSKDVFGMLVRLFSHQKWFAVMTLLLWSITLLWLIAVRLRFSLCKFALLLYPNFSVYEMIKVGLMVTKGKVLYIFFHYIRLTAYCLVLIFSFGLAARKLRKAAPTAFSLWAMHQIEDARKKYFWQKNS